MLDKIDAYIISIKKPRKLLKQIKYFNLNPIWLEAIDKSKLTKEDILKNTTSFYNSFGPISCIAIAMSHIKAWKTFLKTGNEYCVIFEDDVVFEKNFDVNVRIAIQNTPTDFDLLNLGYFETETINIPISIVYKLKSEVIVNKYVKKPKFTSGLHAYVISKKGAELLINLIDKQINNHVDLMIFKLFNKGFVNIYNLNKRLAYQTSTDICNGVNSINHPIILSKLTSLIELDKMFRLNYWLSIKILRIGNINVSPTSIIFFIIGIILAITRVPIKTLTLIFFIISIPDICMYQYIDTIILNYTLFIIPSFLLKILNNILLNK